MADFGGEEDDENWNRPLQTEYSYNHGLAVGFDHHRTILHIDIDCFYAQVEMILDPALQDKPIGIQQKNIIVTCNYLARASGVSKLSYLTDGLKKCPDLILLNGEDLTKYRKMSYEISDFLKKYTRNVERLGFDENYVDVTELVDIRFRNDDFSPEFKGHVFDSSESDAGACNCGCETRLKIGSQIAADVREALHTELGITCCAGIAHNKLLAKLVGSTHKPNQQTTLLTHQVEHIMRSLNGVRAIPGIGSNLAKRLQNLNIISLTNLQNQNLDDLSEHFGTKTAQTLLHLSHGIDETPVVPFSLPQSLSDEDSFKCCDSLNDVEIRVQGLLQNLLQRVVEDGRVPGTVRLTIRRANSTNYTRESRQCPVPAGTFNKCMKTGCTDQATKTLTPALMMLFRKMIDASQPFHLTLINVCFSNLSKKMTSKQTIDSFLKSPKTIDNLPQEKCDSEQTVKYISSNDSVDSKDKQMKNTPKKISNDVNYRQTYEDGSKMNLNSGDEFVKLDRSGCKDIKASCARNFISKSLVDNSVSTLSNSTGDEIVLSNKPIRSNCSQPPALSTAHAGSTHSTNFSLSNSDKTDFELKKLNNDNAVISKETIPETTVANFVTSTPLDIDVSTLKELPLDIQREILQSYGLDSESLSLQNTIKTRNRNSLKRKRSTDDTSMEEKSSKNLYFDCDEHSNENSDRVMNTSETFSVNNDNSSIEDLNADGSDTESKSFLNRKLSQMVQNIPAKIGLKSLPDGIDSEVLSQLPCNIQGEIMAHIAMGTSHNLSSPPSTKPKLSHISSKSPKIQNKGQKSILNFCTKK